MNTVCCGNPSNSIAMGWETLWKSNANYNIGIGPYMNMYENTTGGYNIAL